MSLIKIGHTLVTDNYLAAEEIQNQDWEYFIERVIEVTKSFYYQQLKMLQLLNEFIQ